MQPAAPAAWIGFGLWILNNFAFMAPFFWTYLFGGKSNKSRAFLGSWFHNNKWYLVSAYSVNIIVLLTDISKHTVPAAVGIVF